MAHHERLVGFVRGEAAGLLRYETAEDLAQGIHARALANPERFAFRGEDGFRAWLFTLARRHLADRSDYWSAMKRGSGKVLRLTFGGSSASDPARALHPHASISGPSTMAARRELLCLAAKALDVLPPRDRQLVRWMSESVPLAGQADMLGISYEAAQRAGLRAIDRFRRAYRLVAGNGRPPKSQK